MAKLKRFTEPVKPRRGSQIKASDLENHAIAIRELQRAIEGNGPRVRRPKKGNSHPWKCTANGDDTVTVGEGSILSWPDGDDLTLSLYKEYEGGTSVTVTADGFIYGSIAASLGLDFMASPVDTNNDTSYINRIFPDTSTSISLGFATTMPLSNNIFYWEIAQVTFTDSIATVSKQTLHYNPPIWSFKEPP